MSEQRRITGSVEVSMGIFTFLVLLNILFALWSIESTLGKISTTLKADSEQVICD